MFLPAVEWNSLIRLAGTANYDAILAVGKMHKPPTFGSIDKMYVNHLH